MRDLLKEMLNFTVWGPASNDAQFLSIQLGIPLASGLNELFNDVKSKNRY